MISVELLRGKRVVFGHSTSLGTEHHLLTTGYCAKHSSSLSITLPFHNKKETLPFTYANLAFPMMIYHILFSACLMTLTRAHHLRLLQGFIPLYVSRLPLKRALQFPTVYITHKWYPTTISEQMLGFRVRFSSLVRLVVILGYEFFLLC